MVAIEDVKLVQVALTGNHDAYGELISRYSNAVYSVAYDIVGDFHQAEDIVQETFIKAYQRLSGLREPERVGTWLCTIARRLALDWVRKPHSELAPNEELGLLEHKDHTEKAVVEKERQNLIRRALDTLGDNNRIPTILHYMGDRSSYEIAQLLGISVAAVESRLRRARAQLRNDLLAFTLLAHGRDSNNTQMVDEAEHLLQNEALQPVRELPEYQQIVARTQEHIAKYKRD